MKQKADAIVDYATNKKSDMIGYIWRKTKKTHHPHYCQANEITKPCFSVQRNNISYLYS